MSDSYFYHSFPRGYKEENANSVDKALYILTSIANNGFLLVPEIIEWREPLQGGFLSNSIYNSQKRICFTELAPSELLGHTKCFGPFSLEYGVTELRKLGAVPVFYIPKEERYEYLGGIGGTLIARLYEIQEVLMKLRVLNEICDECSDKDVLVPPINIGEISRNINCTVSSAEELIHYLTEGTQKPNILEYAIRGLSNLFYPTEDIKYNTLLYYYRQREWRIIANIAKDGKPIDRDLEEEEKEAIVEIDKQFFTEELIFPTGKHRRVDQCKYFTRLEGKHVLEFANRVIVPQESVSNAQSLLKEEGLNLEVAALESFGRA